MLSESEDIGCLLNQYSQEFFFYRILTHPVQPLNDNLFGFSDLDTERREYSSPFSRERTEDDILLSRLPEVLPNPDRLEETDDQLPQIIPVLIPTHDNDNDPVPDLVDVDTENLEQLQLLADSLTRDLADTEPRRLRAKRPALDDLDSLVLLKEMENEQDTAENNPDFDFEYQEYTF